MNVMKHTERYFFCANISAGLKMCDFFARCYAYPLMAFYAPSFDSFIDFGFFFFFNIRIVKMDLPFSQIMCYIMRHSYTLLFTIRIVCSCRFIL